MFLSEKVSEAHTILLYNQLIMAIERPLQQFAEFKKQALSYVNKSNTVNTLGKPVFREVAKRASGMYELKDQNNYIDQFYFLRQGKYPVVILNHQSLAEVGIAVEAADRMNKICNPKIKFNLPVAASIKSLQGGFIGNYYNAAKPWVEEHGVEIILVARQKDKKEFNMEATSEEYERIANTVFENKGLMIFMEGETEGGRIDPLTGKRKGMTEIKNKQIPNQVRTSIQQAGLEVVFLPIGVNGGYEIFDPVTKSIPFKAKMNLGAQFVPFASPKMAQGIVGRPFTSTEMFESGIDINDDQAINTFCAKKIAALLPEEARGFYR